MSGRIHKPTSREKGSLQDRAFLLGSDFIMMCDEQIYRALRAGGPIFLFVTMSFLGKRAPFFLSLHRCMKWLGLHIPFPRPPPQSCTAIVIRDLVPLERKSANRFLQKFLRRARSLAPVWGKLLYSAADYRIDSSSSILNEPDRSVGENPPH